MKRKRTYIILLLFISIVLLIIYGYHRHLYNSIIWNEFTNDKYDVKCKTFEECDKRLFEFYKLLATDKERNTEYCNIVVKNIYLEVNAIRNESDNNANTYQNLIKLESYIAEREYIANIIKRHNLHRDERNMLANVIMCNKKYDKVIANILCAEKTDTYDNDIKKAIIQNLQIIKNSDKKNIYELCR